MVNIFSRAGLPPDLPALIVALTPTHGAGTFTVWPTINAAGVLTVHVDAVSPWTAPQIATVQSAVDAAPSFPSVAVLQQRTVDNMDVTLKATELTLIDQLNIIRAALPTPLGAITPAQALAAVRAKAGTL